VLAVSLAALTTPSRLQAGPLPDFTGYTRIGYPPSGTKIDDPIVKKNLEKLKMKDAIGVTVYFMVLDAKGGGRKGVEGDAWGTGIKDFDKRFYGGKDNGRPGLDTKARYLYLYQVVNDSGRPMAIKHCSVRLIVDPRLITSWGYFANRTDEKDKQEGLGFNM